MSESAPRYLTRIPDSIPDGLVLVHNRVRPARLQGTRGARTWLQEPDASKLIVCDCGWYADRGPHYRVRQPDERG